MSPLTSTQTYVFAGEMQLSEELIDIAVEFQGDSVRLRHADTLIGSWPRAETEFVRLSSDHYRVIAEGDSISFHPYTAAEFAQFLSGSTPQGPTPAPSEPGLSPNDPSSDTHGAPLQPEHPDWASEVPLWSPLDQGSDQGEQSEDVARSEFLAPDSIHGPNPARPVYPPNGSSQVQFSSPAPPASFADHTARHPWQQAIGRPAESSAPYPTPPHTSDQPFPTTLGPVPNPREKDQIPPPTPAAELEPDPQPEPKPEPKLEAKLRDSRLLDVARSAAKIVFPEPKTSLPEPKTSLPEPEPSLPEPEPSPAEREPSLAEPKSEAYADTASAPAYVATEAAPVDEGPGPEADQSAPEASLAGTAAAWLDGIRSVISSARSVLRQTEDDAAPPATAVPEDTPGLFDDTENLRQWAMISVVGLAVVGLLAALVWGALSMFGGTDGTSSAPTTIPTTTSTVANAIDRTPATVAAPPVGAPDTTVTQSQSSFVDQWNRLATAYAYNLAIDADSEPVSTAVTANIHLSFDNDGVLTLDMTPVGNGSDRDILVAMGIAVAWAEPDLSPSARKDLLGSLGIDIDNPKLADIGGELSRAGHTYRARVIDRIIQFQVSPAT